MLSHFLNSYMTHFFIISNNKQLKHLLLIKSLQEKNAKDIICFNEIHHVSVPILLEPFLLGESNYSFLNLVCLPETAAKLLCFHHTTFLSFRHNLQSYITALHLLFTCRYVVFHIFHSSNSWMITVCGADIIIFILSFSS